MKLISALNKKSDWPVKEPKTVINSAKDFEQFYNNSANKLFHIALKITDEKEIAEGIVHDFFRILWERRNTLKISVPLEAYAVKAIKFSSFDYLKEKVKKEKVSAETYMAKATTSNGIEEEMQARDLKKEIARLVNLLPNRCQEVFRLRREKFMSNKDIATDLNISEKTVERHMTRALHFLKLGLK